MNNYIKYSIILLFITIILINIYFLLSKPRFDVKECIQEVKLINNSINEINCVEFNTHTYECESLTLNTNFTEWNYQNELKKCINKYFGK